MAFEFTSELYEWSARANWFFVDLPTSVADEITAMPLIPGGFGSVKVEATVGHVTWQTSVFPDDGRGTFVLPIKKDVRTRNGLVPGGPVDVTLEVLR
jgi:predicted Rdx family selenoprotein